MAENQPELKQHGGAAPDPVQPIDFDIGSPVVDSLRVRYPGLEHLDDQTFMRGVRKKFFPKMEEQTFLRGMSKKFGEKPEDGFFKRFGNKILNASKLTPGALSAVRGAKFLSESDPLRRIGKRVAGGSEVPSFTLPEGSQAGNALAMGLGVFKGVTEFGKGVADMLTGVDTPESELAKDMLRELETDLNYTRDYLHGPIAALHSASQGDFRTANSIMNDVHFKYGPRALATLISLPADIAAFGATRRIGGSMMKAAAASGASGGGTYGFISSVAEGKSAEEIAINTSIGTGGGAAAGMLFALGIQGINPHASFGDVDPSPWVTRQMDDVTSERVGVAAAGEYGPGGRDPNVIIPEIQSPNQFLPDARRATGAADIDLPPVTAEQRAATQLQGAEPVVPGGAAPEPTPRTADVSERTIEQIVREQSGVEPAQGLTGAAPVVPERVPGSAGTPEPHVVGEVPAVEPTPLGLETQAEAIQRSAARSATPGAGAPTQVPPGGATSPQPGQVALEGASPTRMTPAEQIAPESGIAAREGGVAPEPAERFGIAGELPARAGEGAPPTPQAEAVPGLQRRPVAGQEDARTLISRGTRALQGPDTGYTYNSDFSEYTGGGKIVGVLSENIPVSGPGDPNIATAVRRMADRAAPLLERFGENAKIGIFQVDEATASVDLNIVVDDVNRALRIGKETGQKAVFDADAKTLVQTGLTGKQDFNVSVPEAVKILEREIGGSQGTVAGISAATPEEAAAAAAVSAAPEPGPGRVHQVDLFADQMIETAAARIKARNQGRLSAFVDPADVADAALIGAGYILRGTAKFADWSALMVEKFGAGVKPHLQRLFKEAQSVHAARRSVGSDPVRLVADDLMREIGLGPVALSGQVEPLSEPFMRRVASTYERLPKFRDTPQTRTAYTKLADEVDIQFKAIEDAGYAVEFVDRDPYPTTSAMLKDLAENKRLKVFKTDTAPHPLLTAEQSAKFRAVHDFFGHAKEGLQFGPEGEFNAWRTHAAMFSDKAVPAMSTETLGQNAWVNFNKTVKAGSALRDRTFATPKAALLPEALWRPVITARKRESAKLAAGVTMKGKQTLGVSDAGRKLTRGIRPAKTPRAQAGRAEADVRAAVQEHLVERPGSREWYKKSIEASDDLVRMEFPQTEDPGQMGLFKLLLAVSSSGNKPEVNMGFAMTMFERFTTSGKIPLLGRTGQEQGRFGRHAVPGINNLMKEFDGDLNGMTKHLMEPGEDGEKRAIKIFGPKIGRFFLNLMGDLDEPTVDVWMRRWWGRINNDLFDRSGNLLDAPKNDREAALIRDTIVRLADDNQMRAAEMQAVLWEREKALWTKAGARDPGDMDFAQAAELVIRNRNKRAGEVGTRLSESGSIFDQAVAEPVVASKETDDMFAALLGPNKKAQKVADVGEQPFWIAPDGGLDVENFGRHPISANLALKRLGREAPKQIGRQHGGIQTLEAAGFIRGQGQFGTVNFEMVRKPTTEQRSIMGQLIKERGFGGAQIFDDAGEPGAFSQAWGEFLRFVDEIKE